MKPSDPFGSESRLQPNHDSSEVPGDTREEESVGPKRLHPLTLVQRLIVSLPGLFFILWPLFRETDSTAWINLIIAGLYALFVLPWIVVYYMRFRYWVTPTEMIIHSGVMTRRERNIPIDRIQNIEIEQAPLQRLLRTAKVAVYTAGSSNAEGILEYVSIDEARDIRASVRQLQTEIKREEGWTASVGAHQSMAEKRMSVPAEREELATEPHSAVPLFQMSTQRAFLSGAFHFSLLYIAGIFSLIQYIEPDPTIFFSGLLRGPMEPWKATIDASPLTAIAFGIFAAVFLGWATGVLLTVNKNYRFSITLQDKKLHRRNGLLTLAEGTIPLKRIQSLIIRTNPVMRFFGYYRLEVQTMGIDLKESGFQLAAPCARQDEIEPFLAAIGGLPFPTDWNPVSPITMRRFSLRYSGLVVLALAGIYYFFPEIFPVAWLGLLVIPVILRLSVARYRNMGYALGDKGLSIRRGIFKQHIWLIPIGKSQTFTLGANYFQRRLGLENLYIDTAGASPMVAAELYDIPAETAHSLLESLYSRFQRRD